MRGIKLHVGREHHVIANRDRRAIEHNHAEIGVKIIAEQDIDAVIALKRRFDFDARPHFAQKAIQQSAFHIALIGAQSVVGAGKFAGAFAQQRQFFVTSIVKLASQHFFTFSHVD